MKSRISLLLVLIWLGSYSCKQDVRSASFVEETRLEGKWEMIEARKGNTVTKMLDNAYFIFSETQAIESNLLQEGQQFKYVLSKNIVEVDNPSKSTFIVQKATSDTLIMATKMRNIEFQFTLKKT